MGCVSFSQNTEIRRSVSIVLVVCRCLAPLGPRQIEEISRTLAEMLQLCQLRTASEVANAGSGCRASWRDRKAEVAASRLRSCGPGTAARARLSPGLSGGAGRITTTFCKCWGSTCGRSFIPAAANLPWQNSFRPWAFRRGASFTSRFEPNRHEGGNCTSTIRANPRSSGSAANRRSRQHSSRLRGHTPVFRALSRAPGSRGALLHKGGLRMASAAGLHPDSGVCNVRIRYPSIRRSVEHVPRSRGGRDTIHSHVWVTSKQQSWVYKSCRSSARSRGPASLSCLLVKVVRCKEAG